MTDADDAPPWWCAEMCDPYPDDDAPGGGAAAASDPDPHAAVAEAMLAHADESMANGDDHLPGVESLRRLLDDPAELGRVLADGGADDEAVGKAVWSVLKAYREADHPRGKNGRFIGKDRIDAAKSDPKLAKKLKEEVKPEDAGKLDAALEGKVDLGRTKRGEARHQAGQRRATREEARAKTAKFMTHLKRVGDLKAELTADDLHDLADHLGDPHVTLDDVRAMRHALAGAGAGRASFGGAKAKADMVKALQAHARKAGLEARMKEHGVGGDDAADMRSAVGLGAKEETPAPSEPEPMAATGGGAGIRPVRFEAGKKLTPAERDEVVRSVRDVYRENGLQKDELKGYHRDSGDPIYGYPHAPEHFVRSDVTGAKVRHYVTLPDGRKAHPSELFPQITQSEIDRHHGEQEAAARDKAHRARAKDSRAAATKGDANAAYGVTRRPIEGSYFARHADGRIVRVDGTDPEDVQHYRDRGFVPITPPVGAKDETPAPEPAARGPVPAGGQYGAWGRAAAGEATAPDLAPPAAAAAKHLNASPVSSVADLRAKLGGVSDASLASGLARLADAGKVSFFSDASPEQVRSRGGVVVDGEPVSGVMRLTDVTPADLAAAFAGGAAPEATEDMLAGKAPLPDMSALSPDAPPAPAPTTPAPGNPPTRVDTPTKVGDTAPTPATGTGGTRGGGTVSNKWERSERRGELNRKLEQLADKSRVANSTPRSVGALAEIIHVGPVSGSDEADAARRNGRQIRSAFREATDSGAPFDVVADELVAAGFDRAEVASHLARQAEKLSDDYMTPAGIESARREIEGWLSRNGGAA